MTRKEKHDPHCKKNPDGTVTFCPHCEFHNPETLAVRSTTTPQQPEEPIGANLDQTGEEFIERISKLPAQQQPEECKNYLAICFNCGRSQSAHPQQQPECKCKKTGTFVTFTGDCPIHAPQQTEQWMEEFDEKFGLDDMHTVWFHRNDIKSFIKSQLEAAYQRGRNDGAEAEAVRDSIHHQP